MVIYLNTLANIDIRQSVDSSVFVKEISSIATKWTDNDQRDRVVGKFLELATVLVASLGSSALSSLSEANYSVTLSIEKYLALDLSTSTVDAWQTSTLLNSTFLKCIDIVMSASDVDLSFELLLGKILPVMISTVTSYPQAQRGLCGKFHVEFCRDDHFARPRLCIGVDVFLQT